MTKRMLSGMQVTGKSHLGNYFGAMRQFLELQNSGNEVFVMVANLHSLNSVSDAKNLKENTIDLVKDYLAIGLDPEKITLFLQSDVSAHTELTWIFDCLVTVPYMERSHAYKDKIANGLEPNMGLFNYPVLMAADILLYSPDVVPVGQDQKQHIEYARDIANKFNFTYDEKNANGDVLSGTFKLPEDYILPDVKVVPGIDGRKMSKSYKNHIPLFASDEEIKKLCMSIVTDTAAIADKKNADGNNIFNIYRALSSKEETEIFRAKLENGGVGYGDLKKELAQKIIDFIKPMREKRENISDEYVFEVMKKGAEKANIVANKKMEEVREKAGIIRNI
jgi:tryptophanyl-tRNA synthetase